MTEYLIPYKSDLKEIFSFKILIEYYSENIEKIAEILGVEKSKIPVGITIHLNQKKDGLGARYNRSKKSIEYDYRDKNTLSEDIGRLIHEGAHVVQGYPEGIDRKHPCWCWMEGIADYCRYVLDKEFDIKKDLVGEPNKGFKETAHFILWLKEENPLIVKTLNENIRVNAHSVNNYDEILGHNFIDLRREYKKQYEDIFSTRPSTMSGR